MNILFVGAEASPFIKTGGLADVLGSLPKALHKLNHNVSVVLPYYKKIKDKNECEYLTNFDVYINNEKKYCGLFKKVVDNVTYYFIDNNYYFYRDGNIYGHFDDGERFSFFSIAVLEMIFRLPFTVDILHTNDWHCGMIPFILEHNYRHYHLSHRNIKTVYSIHNIQYQGIFPRSLCPYLNIPYCGEIEFDGNINFMKAAIVASNLVTTVSNTYKDEIQTAQYGYGLNHILVDNNHKLYGIVNGIDYDVFNPEVDNFIYYKFNNKNYLELKELNKKALFEEFGLKYQHHPLFVMVSRLAYQKGIEFISEIIEDVINYSESSFFFMGSGEKEYEEYFKYLAKKYPDRVKVYIGYNEALAQKLYAASDFFLMPSRFEPCGLSQLISYKYGSIPLVRQTGGLNDTVQPFNKFTLEGTGFSFNSYDARHFKDIIFEAISLYNIKENYRLVQNRVLNLDFSWDRSAKDYEKIYKL